MSLDALAKRILGVTLNKSQKIQCSNWEEEKLSGEQIEYAMNDALVASHIFLTLVKGKAKQSLVSEDSSPGEKDFSFGDLCIEDLANDFGRYETTVNLAKFESEEMEGYLSTDEVINLISDPYFAQRAGSLCQGLTDIPFKARKRYATQGKKKEKWQMSSKSGAARKSPLYKNCILTTPKGSRLCCLDRKKADWYIEKELGKVCLDRAFS